MLTGTSRTVIIGLLVEKRVEKGEAQILGQASHVHCHPPRLSGRSSVSIIAFTSTMGFKPQPTLSIQEAVLHHLTCSLGTMTR